MSFDVTAPADSAKVLKLERLAPMLQGLDVVDFKATNFPAFLTAPAVTIHSDRPGLSPAPARYPDPVTTTRRRHG